MLLASTVVDDQFRSSVNDNAVAVIGRLVYIAFCGEKNYFHLSKPFHPGLVNLNSTGDFFLVYPPKFIEFSHSILTTGCEAIIMLLSRRNIFASGKIEVNVGKSYLSTLNYSTFSHKMQALAILRGLFFLSSKFPHR